MQKLSLIQKTLLVLAIIIFVIINIVSLYIVISNRSTVNATTSISNTLVSDINTITYDLDGRELTKKGYILGEDISTTNNLKAEYPNNIVLYSTSDLKFNIKKIGFPSTLMLTVNKGIVFFETKTKIAIELSGKTIEIPANVNVIYNADESTLILVSGEISLTNSKKATSNDQILLEVTQFQTYKFDRTEYADSVYSTLLDFLEVQNITPDNLKDFEAPTYTSISPNDEFSTEEPTIRFYGFTEGGSTAIVNDKKLEVDEEGEFTTQLDLKLGKNIVKLILEDKYGNQQVYTFTYTRLQPISSPILSYPASYPVSYNQ